MVTFCNSEADITPLWIWGGFSPCFFYIVFPTTHLLIVIISGVFRLSFKPRFSPRIKLNELLKFWFIRFYLMLFVVLIMHPFLKLGLEALINKSVFGYQLICCFSSSCSWLISLLIMVADLKRMANHEHVKSHSWALLVPITLAFIIENLKFMSFSSELWFFIKRSTKKDIELGFFCIKYLLTAFTFILALWAPKFKLAQSSLREESEDDDELLTNLEQNSESGPWNGLKKKIFLLWPFLWPKGNLPLQACVLFGIFLLVSGRVVNLFLPIYYKKIVESLTPNNRTSGADFNDQPSGVEFRWDYILTYLALWFLQGGGLGSVGFLNGLRSFLWTWVQQYAIRTTEVQLFSHLHSLSLRWHMSRKTGEVLRIVDRGTTSVNNLLNYMIFNVMPTIADVIIAIIFFLISFNNWFAIIIFVTMSIYLVVTIAVTEWRTKFRKRMNKLDNEMNARAVGSLLNFETVKYYGAEDFEVGRYKEAFKDFQKAEWISNSTSNLLDFLQNIVITGGMLVGSLLSAWYVSKSKLTVGDYVLFASYMIQLCSPLNSFGTYYRMIQKSLIDMDNMFELLDVEHEVKDVDNAPDLSVTEGQIEFKNISFHYRPDKEILKNVSFVVPPGKTYALVGPSGAGKSTIIRLLFRFYDVQSGNILIDGQDISKVRQKSLRSFIGVVPQDTVLFNNDIEYNIKYGKVRSTFEEMQNAAKVAEIHDRILSFPDGYGTLVGERGLKLSGGEKQRVAIARTVLKAPIFVLLDEATSALDTQTERQIQTSLSKVCENRTTIIVAHRLSTIIHADKIIVLKDGSIVESGRHDELLQKEGGVYADMWNQQLTKLEDQDEHNLNNVNMLEVA